MYMSRVTMRVTDVGTYHSVPNSDFRPIGKKKAYPYSSPETSHEAVQSMGVSRKAAHVEVMLNPSSHRNHPDDAATSGQIVLSSSNLHPS